MSVLVEDIKLGRKMGYYRTEEEKEIRSEIWAKEIRSEIRSEICQEMESRLYMKKREWNKRIRFGVAASLLLKSN